MSKPAFVIPTRSIYWETSPAQDPVQRMASSAWTLTEARRAQSLAVRLFPDVEFELSEDPPPSQTYHAGSINEQIRQLLESRTALRFVPRRSRS